MKTNKIIAKSCLYLVLVCALLTGCRDKKTEESNPSPAASESRQWKEIKDYTVDPETFALSVGDEGRQLPVSLPGERRSVQSYTENQDEKSWEYPDQKISVTVKKEAGYLRVVLTSSTDKDNQFQWPLVSGETYYMPLGEGKMIPAQDPVWKDYLRGGEVSAMEQLSMPFWAAVRGEYAVLYIMENPFRSKLIFGEESSIQFGLNHQYPEIDKGKENSFRIYLTDNDPVSIAKIYRQYALEQGKIVSLKEKEDQNPNVGLLYGAPHIYLWGENLIGPENINWPAFRDSLDSPIWGHILDLAGQTETGAEAGQAITKIAGQDYVDQYQKNVICRYLGEALRLKDFYRPEVFPVQNEAMKELEAAEGRIPEDFRLIQRNKEALALNLSRVFQPAGEWLSRETVELIGDLKASGLERAWIGLNSWEQAYARPDLANTAAEAGYLIGPYDSYHSIHEPGGARWITAEFPDASLYDQAAVRNKDGEFVSGFQNVGRKLNPTLSLPSVKQRVGEIMSSGIPFNSWFIDCDATGEIYDDYSPAHQTAQQEDLKARLERMSYIRDNFNLVVGSEGGNDFAAADIAFAHGIELQSFSWMDEDMSKNKESQYYIGNYYNPNGGVAQHFAKRIPLKARYYSIFLDPRYDLPLFRLVYNDSVITSYHWDWSTFKIIGATEDRMVREVLYNTPPLYHLDREEWERYKEDMTAHTKVWSQFGRQAVLEEMTDFKYLTEDRGVQLTRYGDGLMAVGNFGDTPFAFEGNEIPGHSVLINIEGKVTIYTPSVAKENK